MTNDELNRAIAEARGWKRELANGAELWKKPRIIGGGGFMPSRSLTYINLPDIAGDDCEAIRAAKWMASDGWQYSIEYWGELGHDAEFWRATDHTIHGRSKEQPTLSLAVANAMLSALREGK